MPKKKCCEPRGSRTPDRGTGLSTDPIKHAGAGCHSFNTMRATPQKSSHPIQGLERRFKSALRRNRSLTLFALVWVLALGAAGTAQAAVTVTAATGGTNVSA